jgi:hypothetical protein
MSSINVGEPLVLSKTQSRIIHDFDTIALQDRRVTSVAEESVRRVGRKVSGKAKARSDRDAHRHFWWKCPAHVMAWRSGRSRLVRLVLTSSVCRLAILERTKPKRSVLHGVICIDWYERWPQEQIMCNKRINYKNSRTRTRWRA